MARAWVGWVGASPAVDFAALVAVLTQAGLEVDDRPILANGTMGTVGAGAPYGVLVFDDPCEEVRDSVRAASRGGRRRVLAVCLRPTLEHRDAWALMRSGAADVLAAVQTPGELAAQVVARLDRWAAVDELLDSPWVAERMVGHSPAWRARLLELAEAARFTQAPFLILGESGTGKEAAAQMVHELDPRPDKQKFVVLDCTTITPELSGSEFFGHERGAFTGAVSQREGAFALAHGGTLFLDEVGELPLPLQAQLLRVIQERQFKRVGGNAWHSTEFRLVCATNRNLEEMVGQGRFRADLFYRLASVVTTLPPLRERVEDILPLAEHFVRGHCIDGAVPNLDAALRDYLQRREYRGNVRELKQLMARLMHRHVGRGPLTIGAIPPEDRPDQAWCEAGWHSGPFEQGIRHAVALGARLKDISRTAEDLAVQLAVVAAGGNLQRAALALGVTDRALQLRRASRRDAQDAP